MKRVLVLAVAVVLLAGVPAPAASGSCSAESPLASSAGGPWLGGCDGDAACPSTVTRCDLRVTAEVGGVGVVGVRIIVDGLERGRCAYGLEICSATASARIQPGDRVRLACRFIDGAAIDVELSCGWTI